MMYISLQAAEVVMDYSRRLSRPAVASAPMGL